jgi:hypothetical protein
VAQRFKCLRLLVVAAACSAVSAAAAASPPQLEHQSWPDPVHGWASSGESVYGTENGGRSWRLILRGLDPVLNVQRTSARAGFVAAIHSQFLTVDAGRHWFLATGRVVLETAIGRGRTVYWSGSNGAEIARLTAWPPRQPRCRDGWRGDPSGAGAGPRPRNICAGTVVPLRSRILYRLQGGDPNDQLFPAALVPGGVAGFVTTDCGGFCNEPVRVFVYRNGAAIIRTLPPASALSAGTVFPPGVLGVSWPTLIVTATTGYWISDNGGHTWRYVG